MANLTETAQWENGVYQIETTDPVVGGPPNLQTKAGVANIQAQQLAHRTLYLKQSIEADDPRYAMAGDVYDKNDVYTKSEVSEKITQAHAPDDPRYAKANSVYTKAQVDTKVKHAGPAGAVIAFAGSVVPTGWLECNGATLSRTVYADLYAVIGTTYGAGDFNLPDLRGELVRGWGHGVDNECVFWQPQALQAAPKMGRMILLIQ